MRKKLKNRIKDWFFKPKDKKLSKKARDIEKNIEELQLLGREKRAEATFKKAEYDLKVVEADIDEKFTDDKEEEQQPLNQWVELAKEVLPEVLPRVFGQNQESGAGNQEDTGQTGLPPQAKQGNNNPFED